jgi:hypothetical protein
MRTVRYTVRFRRDYKREKSGGHGKRLDAELLEAVTILRRTSSYRGDTSIMQLAATGVTPVGRRAPGLLRLSISGCFGERRKRSVGGPAQAAARLTSIGCQFQGRSSAMRRAGWSAMRASTSAR